MTLRLHSVHIQDILISANRQRKEFDHDQVVKLAGSISTLGLIHPIVVRKNPEGVTTLVAGERRLRALDYIWRFGEQVKCGEHLFSEDQVPCLHVGDLDEITAKEMELEENIRRVDLSWQAQAAATAELMTLRQAKATRDGEIAPTVNDISAEVRGESPSSVERTRKDILLAKHLSDPEVAGAKTREDAFKLLKRRESIAKNIELAAKVGLTFNAQSHTLLHGDSMELCSDLPKESFDVILTDPPYGIDADKFSDSGGIAQGSHFYDDSWTYWNKVAKWLASESFRLAKPQAHAYVFCDVDQFVLLKNFFIEAGWRVFRTPLVWVNPSAARAPWPEHGPQRKYQLCLYAVKGNRIVNRVTPDFIVYPSDDNLGHQAQKPVGLYTDLLSRSVRPGDTVLDCFGGSGPILPAAHDLKCKATYIEMDAAAYGIAINRLKGLE